MTASACRQFRSVSVCYAGFLVFMAINRLANLLAVILQNFQADSPQTLAMFLKARQNAQ